MDYGKYIVLNESHIIIFDPALSHKDVARGFTGFNITSAGFIMTTVDAKTNEVHVGCHGRSVTLDISSVPEIDDRLARYALGIH